jgi:hypothetical protein
MPFVSIPSDSIRSIALGGQAVNEFGRPPVD